MMKATEANEIFKNAITAEVAKRQVEAEKFCDGLGEHIKKAAEDCRNSIMVDLPNELRVYIRTILSDNGYTIKCVNNSCTISW